MTAPVAAPSSEGRPFYLEGCATPVLAWWHAPPSGALADPVLMCPTWGDEEIGAYQGWRALAVHLAQAGVPVLRLDLPGEGDSADLPFGEDRWAVWLQVLNLAADQACEWAQTDGIQLLGLRLGALLAMQLAQQRLKAGRGVASVALIAPVGSGRAFLREARMLGTAPDDEPLAPGEVVAGGFVLDAASATGIGQAVWPMAMEGATIPLRVIERWDRPLPDSAKGVLQAWGQPLDWTVRDDLAGLFSIAHSAVWPQDLPAQLSEWALAKSRQEPAPLRAWSGGTVVEFGGLSEGLVPLGEGRWAHLTRPAGGDLAPHRALLLLSSGAERRIGPHRLWVAYARLRAEYGETVLRLDLAGVGDSRPGTDVDGMSQADQIYAKSHLADIQAAVQLLRGMPQVESVAIVGLCSGAYHAWRAAVAGVSTGPVVVVNPLVFHWRSGMTLDPTDHAFGQIDIADGAVRSLGDPARWLKLLRGQVKVSIILKAMWGRVVGRLVAVTRATGRQLGWPLSEDVVSDVRQAVRSGARLHFVFAEGDPGQDLLRQEAGRWLTTWQKDRSVHLTTISPAEHTFSSRSSRERLYNCLSAILGAERSSLSTWPKHSAPDAPQQS